MLPSFHAKRELEDEDEDEKPKRTPFNRLVLLRVIVRASITALVYVLLHEQYRTPIKAKLSGLFSQNPLRNIEPAYLDLTRSSGHRATIRPSVTFELNTLGATGLFPEWYGQPREVGLSPFDYVLPAEWRKAVHWTFLLAEQSSGELAESRSSHRPDHAVRTLTQCSLGPR